MKALLVKDGDIALGPGGYQMVSGARKVTQDMGIASLEPFRSDRFHTRWGSMLPHYVGAMPTQEVGLLIRSEITRLVRNYMVIQNSIIEEDQVNNRRARLSETEIVVGIDRIQIQAQQDRLRVRVFLRTLAGESLSLVTAVG